MPILAAQLPPQRSPQYTEMLQQLAPLEISASPLSAKLQGNIQAQSWGGQPFFQFELSAPLNAFQRHTLSQLALCSGVFEVFPELDGQRGPFLRPLELPDPYILPPSLITTRRYAGKTNELFTQMLCNLARFSSDFAKTPWPELSLLDPLSGGGTTLWAALTLGADVAGVENNKKVAEGTPDFLRKYFSEAEIVHTQQQEKIKKVGQRWIFEIDSPELKKQQRCILAHGDTRDTPSLITGLKRPKLIVSDLPYGIQHAADWKKLLHSALPVWEQVLAPGGALCFSWNATHFQRPAMLELVEEACALTLCRGGLYEQLQHPVDRVIKQRDVLVARKA